MIDNCHQKLGLWCLRLVAEASQGGEWSRLLGSPKNEPET